MSNLDPCAPHVYIDDNAAICTEARLTNALVVEVNLRTGVLGLLSELNDLRDQMQIPGVPSNGGTESTTLLGGAHRKKECANCLQGCR